MDITTLTLEEATELLPSCIKFKSMFYGQDLRIEKDDAWIWTVSYVEYQQDYSIIWRIDESGATLLEAIKKMIIFLRENKILCK